jgi:hypothetical protein
MWGPICDYVKLESTDKLWSEIVAEEKARTAEASDKTVVENEK